MKSQIRYNNMYKHSFGHFSTNVEAIMCMKELEKEYPDKELHVAQEKRSNNTWPKYCVCEYVPFKRDKDKVKKSNHKGTHKHSHYKKKKRDTMNTLQELRLCKQRDELLAALEGMLSVYAEMINNPPYHNTDEIGRTVQVAVEALAPYRKAATGPTGPTNQPHRENHMPLLWNLTNIEDCDNVCFEYKTQADLKEGETLEKPDPPPAKEGE